MKDRIALVTGGGRGIGAATCKLLAQRGASVAVNFARDAGAAAGVVEEVIAHGGQAIAVQADVRDPEQVQRMIDTIVAKWGRIDVLVNNANMSFAMKPISDMTWEEFSQKLNDEMKAAFILTKAVTPIMSQHLYGRIVYVASGLAKRPVRRMAAHGSAKASLVQFAKYVAEEYGQNGITANVISPGLVLTEATAFQSEEQLQRTSALTPLGHVATTDDVARAIAMYCSDDVGFVTGTYLPVNGGASMD